MLSLARLSGPSHIDRSAASHAPSRGWTIVAVLLVCTGFAPSASADGRPNEITFASLSGKEVDASRLTEVRAGAAMPAIPTQQLGVILWDELRIPPPPVRINTGDSSITGRMNVFQR